MDLEDLVRLAAAYGVHPAALLIAPDEANETVSRMQDACTLAERMPPEVADEWLAMGRRVAKA